MIQASELRIGNWVTDEFKDARKLISVEKTAVEFEHGIRNIYKNLKPIPLTEEWLEKFDWEKEGIYYDSFEKSFYVFSGLGDPSSYGKKVKLEYVHQLQNLYFALTGEELTLNEEEL